MSTVTKLSVLISIIFSIIYILPKPLIAADKGFTSVRDTLCSENAGKGTQVCDKNLKDAQKNVNTNKGLMGKNGTIARIVQTLIFVSGALSVIMIIIGGFRYVISGGDSNATKGAKDTILYAIIGLVVVLFAQVIVRFVIARR